MIEEDELDFEASEERHEKRIKEEEERLRQVAFQRRDDISFLMNTKQGRRFIWRLLERSGLFNSVLSEGVEKIMHRSGEQDFGQFIYEIVADAAPNEFIEMHKAQLKEKKEKKLKVDDAEGKS